MAGNQIDDLNEEPSNEDADEGLQGKVAKGKEPSQEKEQPLFIQPDVIVRIFKMRE